jgi:hypothetical protein
VVDQFLDDALEKAEQEHENAEQDRFAASRIMIAAE